MINILKIYQLYRTIVAADSPYGSGNEKQVP